MPKTFSWVCPFRPQKPLKQLLPFVRNDTFYWATACRFYRTDTLRVLYVAAPQVFFWTYISEFV